MVSGNRQRWVDWAGCLFTVLFGIAVYRRSAALGILLLPPLVEQLLIALSFLLRCPPRAAIKSWRARIAAYGVSFLIPAYLALGPVVLPLKPPAWISLAGLCAWLVGCCVAAWGAWTMRRSFSIEPQARVLMTRGPYRLLRHPMYASYVLQYGAIFFVKPSLSFLVVLVAWAIMLRVRIGYEEQVLAQVFPEYATYRRTTGALFPRLQIARRPAAPDLPYRPAA